MRIYETKKNKKLSLVTRSILNLISDLLISLGGQVAGEEIDCLVKVMLFTMDVQRQNQIKSNFFGLELCYLHPEIEKTLSNSTLSESIRYFINSSLFQLFQQTKKPGETANHYVNHVINCSK